LGCAIVLSVQVSTLVKPDQIAADDFVEYWSAARLNVAGGNPYSPGQMKALQTQAGKTDAPLMMWNPPWALALLMPFGLLPYSYARVLWLLTSTGMLFACAACIWWYFGANPKKAWVAWLVGFLFAPALQVIKVGQIGPFFLTGITGFLYFEKKKKWWLAGTLAALTTLKPHLFYLFLLALLLWSCRQKNGRVLAGLGLAVSGAFLIGWMVNPSLPGQYVYAATHYPPADYASASLGTMLRVIFGEGKFWLQFVAPAAGCAWLLAYWWGKRSDWQWSEQISLVLLVSTATAAYEWTFDQVALLVPVVLVGLWCWRQGWSRRVVWLYLPYLVVNVIMVILPVYQDAYWWTGMGFLLWYLWAQSWFGLDIAPGRIEVGHAGEQAFMADMNSSVLKR
jgi:hypothetical protein